ncbi:MAG: DNA polymerase III subunit delta [Chthoniobacter sp.]|uniref:DNA polymerase III subunit delta n=1 Tax=Chthoniobacter sp. TaxID=2510640 RepID=UPI0032A14852
MPVAKTKASAQICAIVGSDESEVKRVAKDTSIRMAPADGGDFSSDVIDGVADNADQAATRIHQAIEALLTFPFFGGEKLVWLKNANFLADNPMGRAAAVIEALEKLAETLSGGLPESTRFLLSAIDVDKRRSFYKGLGKLGKVEVYDRVDSSKSGWEEEAAALARERADQRGLQLSGDALELFALSTGGDRRVMENELEKLDLYLGAARRAVTVDDVRDLVPLSRAGIVFELGNALAARDLPRSLALLDQLLFQGESAIGILLVAIIPTVRSLLIAKDLMARHKLSRPQQPFFFGKTLEKLPEAATAHLPRKKDGTVNAYALGLAAMHVQRYQMPELRAAFRACLEANIRLVTSSMEADVVLSQLLVRIIAPGHHLKN